MPASGEGGRSLSQSREQHRARNILVVVQVAFGSRPADLLRLMIRTFRALMHVPPGFVGATQCKPSAFTCLKRRYQTPKTSESSAWKKEILNKLAAIPACPRRVFELSSHGRGRFQRSAFRARPLVCGRRHSADTPVQVGIAPDSSPRWHAASSPACDITGRTPIRKFPVALVSENFAREYWHDANNTLGKRVRAASTDDWREIIGVVADVHDDGVNQDAPPPCTGRS